MSVAKFIPPYAKFLLAIAVGGLLAIAAGCTQTSTTVEGAVTLDGRPLSIGDDSRGTIVFQPANGQGTVASGILNPTGHFKLTTGRSTEVAPGKYQVAVSVIQLLPEVKGTEQGGKRISPGKYATAGTSGLEKEVIPGPNVFEFDMVSSPDTSSSGAGTSAGSVTGAQIAGQSLQRSAK
jgi:hypothetical protein